MQNRFEQAIRLMGEAGYEDLAQRLRQESEAMAADTYKIAVVGEFKTCKSTLINKVFLKDDILFTDIMEATAVPTEISYSRDKYLEIAPYEKKTATKPNPFKNGAEEQVEEIGEEGEPFRIYDPTPEDIEKHTSAPSTGERARLAGEISRVKLGWPSPHLAGLTIFDTPGINSINEAVIATTYRVIPESDLVLFLTTARQLSEIELEFLTGRVLSEGITRVMTVIAYDPHIGALSAQQRKKLVDAIKGQLAGIGHGDIPVEMVDIRDRPGELDDGAAMRDRIDGGETREKDGRKVVDSVIGGLLGEKVPAGGRTFERFDDDSDDSIGIAALEEKIIEFIRENVRPARVEKASRVLQNQVRLAKVRCSTEIAALGKSESERKQLLDDFKSRERKIKEEQGNPFRPAQRRPYANPAADGRRDRAGAGPHRRFLRGGIRPMRQHGGPAKPSQRFLPAASKGHRKAFRRNFRKNPGARRSFVRNTPGQEHGASGRLAGGTRRGPRPGRRNTGQCPPVRHPGPGLQPVRSVRPVPPPGPRHRPPAGQRNSVFKQNTSRLGGRRHPEKQDQGVLEPAVRPHQGRHGRPDLQGVRRGRGQSSETMAKLFPGTARLGPLGLGNLGGTAQGFETAGCSFGDRKGTGRDRVDSGTALTFPIRNVLFFRYNKRGGTMTIQTTYTHARSQLASLIDEVANNREVVIIKRRGFEDVAMIAADELSGLLETAHLLRSPANAERIFAALERARKKEGKSQTVEDLRHEVGFSEAGFNEVGLEKE